MLRCWPTCCCLMRRRRRAATELIPALCVSVLPAPLCQPLASPARLTPMGIIREAKAGTAADHAARARAEGRTAFLYKFSIPAGLVNFSGPIAGAAEVIESIELAGWALVDMAYDGAQRKNGSVLLLFRP